MLQKPTKLGRPKYGVRGDEMDPVIWMCSKVGLETPNGTRDTPILQLCHRLECSWSDIMDLLFDDMFIVREDSRVVYWETWLDRVRNKKSEPAPVIVDEEELAAFF